MVVCSTAFTTLGRAQASALGQPGLPIAVIPHPFGNRTRAEIEMIAEHCLQAIVDSVTEGTAVAR